jgi:hypothetical protein
MFRSAKMLAQLHYEFYLRRLLPQACAGSLQDLQIRLQRLLSQTAALRPSNLLYQL